MILLDGDALAARMRAAMALRVKELAAQGRTPCIATLLIGNDPFSAAYISRKHADCAALGIMSRDLRITLDTDTDSALEQVRALNNDQNVTGFLVQLPLPDHLDEQTILESISPEKDIDGLHPVNLGRLVAGTDGILPCTPAGILALLRHYDVPLAGRNVAIVGRGALVGRPLAMLLSRSGVDATVTLLHSHSTDIAEHTGRADLVISAAGVQGLIRADMLRPGAAVVGVGISYDAAGNMVSDIAEDVAGIAGWVTPPHGSVGALTRAFLLQNVLDLC